MSELFSGAAILGEIFYNLSLAILASAIFYFVVIHLKDFYDKRDVFKIVSNRLNGFINIRNRIQMEIVAKNNLPFDNKNISEDLIKEIFSKINPSDNSPVVIFPTKGKHTWLDFLILFSNKSLDLIKDTYQFMPYLDKALLNLLYKIESSNFIVNLKSFDSTPNYEYADLTPFAKSFYNYSKIIDELDSYIEEKTKLYM